MVSAQDFSITRYDERNGLTADVIYGIVQDKQGFLWLGTENGVFRFDGAAFKKFSVDDGLTDNVALGLHVSNANHILFESFSGNPCYYFNGRFYNTDSDTALQQLRMKGVNHYKYLKEKDQFIYAQPGHNYFRLIQFINGRLNVRRVSLSVGHQLLVTSPLLNRFVVLSGYRDTLMYHIMENERPVQSAPLPAFWKVSARVSLLYFNNLLYVGVDSTLYSFAVETGNRLALKSKKDYPFKIKYIFPGKQGLYITLFQPGVYYFHKQEEPELLLPDAIVNHVYEDRDGNVWMGTDGKGLYMLKENRVQNLSVQNNAGSARVVTLLAGNHGQVFCGYDNMTVTRYANGQTTHYMLSETGKPETGFITSMQFRNSNEILVSTARGLLLLNIHTRAIRQVLVNGEKMAYIKCLYTPSNSIFYAGTSNSLLRLTLGTQAFITDTLLQERTISVHPGTGNVLWAGTLTGLHTVTSRMRTSQKSEQGLLGTAKINAATTRNGLGYFATDRGIVIAKGKTIAVVNKASGLTDENCKRVCLYKNAIYTATSSGVFKIELVNDSTPGAIIQYNQWDGLASDNVNDLLVQNDTVWAATNKGLNIFTPGNIPLAPEPGVAILGLSTGKNSYPVYNGPQTIPAGENNVTINYSGISFYHRDGLYFEYRLLKQSENWVRTTGSSVTFNGLKPGDYTFEIRAFNARGIPGAVTGRISFSIKPFFWQTGWFRLLLILTLAGLAIWLLRLRERQVKRKQRLRVEYENKVSELELEAIKAQINPHFIYNCLNAIQNSILKNNMEESHRQLSLFSKLVRKTLDLSRSNFITLAEEITYLDMYLQLEKMRFREQLQYTIEAEPGVAVHETEIPVMLLQPFVENAVKHGLKTNEGAVSEIKVRFGRNSGMLLCTIEDGGAGMPHHPVNTHHHSMGIHISSGRADTYNKLFQSGISIRFINKAETGSIHSGTIVFIQIPLK